MWAKIRKVVYGGIVVVVLVILVGGVWVYRAAHRPVDAHFAGTCSVLDLPGSAEDIQIDRERGFAYLSVLDRLASARGDEVDGGMVFRIDLNSSPEAVPALSTLPEHLHNHGLSLHIDEDGQRYLFVINHAKDRGVGPEAVELFVETGAGKFAHEATFSDPLLTKPNDLVAVGPRQFYVANDSGQSRDAGLQKLVYFNGETFSVVADDIASGGGINVSADGQTIYVSETDGKAVRVLARNPVDGSLVTTGQVGLRSAPDNIDVAEDGSLYIGAHSNLIALVMHFIAGWDAPTQILRVNFNAKGEAAIEEVYLNAGDEITTGSGGATYDNKLVIGSITARKILICERDG